MPELGEQIRTYIEAVAPPVGFDEVTRAASVDLEPDVAASGRRRRPWATAAAAAAVVAVGAGLALVLSSRDSSPGPLTAVPPPSASTDASAAATNVEPTTPQTVDPEESLTPFGAEVEAPPVPAGWKVLDFADFRFAVPEDWEVPITPGCLMRVAPGVVLVTEDEPGSGCSPTRPAPPSVVRFEAGHDEPAVGTVERVGTLTATRLPGNCEGCPTRYQFDNGYRLMVSGPDAEAVLATFTDSGARRALQSGPVADMSAWQSVEYEGISVRVPGDWPVDDLPASYTVRTLPNGNIETSVRLNPGQCGGSMFPAGITPRVSLGMWPSTRPPHCPASFSINLQPGDGVWIRPLGDETVQSLGSTIAHAEIGGLDLTFVRVRDSIRWTPQPVLDVVVQGGSTSVWITLGVGLDASTARAILRSLAAVDG